MCAWLVYVFTKTTAQNHNFYYVRYASFFSYSILENAQEQLSNGMKIEENFFNKDTNVCRVLYVIDDVV